MSSHEFHKTYTKFCVQLRLPIALYSSQVNAAFSSLLSLLHLFHIQLTAPPHLMGMFCSTQAWAIPISLAFHFLNRFCPRKASVHNHLTIFKVGKFLFQSETTAVLMLRRRFSKHNFFFLQPALSKLTQPVWPLLLCRTFFKGRYQAACLALPWDTAHASSSSPCSPVPTAEPPTRQTRCALRWVVAVPGLFVGCQAQRLGLKLCESTRGFSGGWTP